MCTLLRSLTLRDHAQASNSKARNSLPFSTADPAHPRRRMHSPQRVFAARIRVENDIVFANSGAYVSSVSNLGAISGRRSPLAATAAGSHIGTAALRSVGTRSGWGACVCDAHSRCGSHSVLPAQRLGSLKRLLRTVTTVVTQPWNCFAAVWLCHPVPQRLKTRAPPQPASMGARGIPCNP